MSPFDRRLQSLTRDLAKYSSPGIFNPYADHDPELDGAQAAANRRRNLRLYLSSFRKARFMLVGEAAGYNGCRFSGIPFTGEDLLVGERALPWARSLDVRRSSLPARRLSSERSAAIVWQGLGTDGDAVLWNTVPWHPHRPDEPLSNRRPRSDEVAEGLKFLPAMLELLPQVTAVAVGRIAEAALNELGVENRYVRHPSMGGKNLFLAGLAELRKR